MNPQTTKGRPILLEQNARLHVWVASNFQKNLCRTSYLSLPYVLSGFTKCIKLHQTQPLYRAMSKRHRAFGQQRAIL